MIHHQGSSKHQDYSYRSDTQKLTHWRSQLLTACHPKERISEVLIQRVELLFDILGCGVSLHYFDATERLVEHAHKLTHTLLALSRRTA